jgi:hypothetical protein
MALNASDFSRFLLRHSERWDGKIFKDTTPLDDSWIGYVSTGSFQPDWWECREAVRRIVEGITYKQSQPKFGPEESFDRLEAIFPDLKSSWESVGDGGVLGALCDS